MYGPRKKRRRSVRVPDHVERCAVLQRGSDPSSIYCARLRRHLDPVAPLMASNQGAYEPSPTVAASMAPPVLNAARPAALQAAAAAPPYPGTSAAAGSATGGPVQVAAPAAAGGAGLQALLQPVSALVAEPCESLVSYLSDPDTWCGPLTDLVAAAVEGGMDGAALAAAVATSGSAAEHSTAGSLVRIAGAGQDVVNSGMGHCVIRRAVSILVARAYWMHAWLAFCCTGVQLEHRCTSGGRRS